MTGKRFTLYDGLDIKDNVTGEIIPPCLDKGLERLIDLLNALNDENEQLRKDSTVLILANKDYRKENEQLRTKNNAYIQDIEVFKEENTHLKLENEQLKCGNKNLKSTLNDFINILNRLQSNPNDKQTVAVARDMLQNMGVDLE